MTSYRLRKSSIEEHIQQAALRAGRNPQGIFYTIVSKGRSLAEIEEAYRLGIRDFAENRVTEALTKKALLPADIRWHFIGKLQKNKVSKVVGQFTLIHSIDTFELAEKVAHSSQQRGVYTPILLEANTSGEKSKSGLEAAQWIDLFPQLMALGGIEIKGLMTMAPLGGDEHTIRNCFSSLKKLEKELNQMGGHLSVLSMGMSRDFQLAIAEGATLLRLGTIFFD